MHENRVRHHAQVRRLTEATVSCKTVSPRTLRSGSTRPRGGSTRHTAPHCDGSKLPAAPLDNVDQLTLRTFQAFGRAFHLHRQALLRGISKTGLHHGEVIALRLLAESDGMSQRELADVLHLSRPRVTTILQNLERTGAVRRSPDPDDQRLTRVFLTDKGRQQEQANRAAFEEYVTATIGALDDADKVELERLLDALSARIAERLQSSPGPEAGPAT